MPNNKTHLIVTVLLSLTLLGLIFLWQSRNTPVAQVRLGDIPLELGEWKGEDITISQRTYEILETKDVLMREYTNAKGEKLWLAIVYSGVNRGSFHPPEICYLGEGRELLNKGIERIEIAKTGKNPYSMQVSKLLMEDRAGKEIAWHWFTAGSRVTPSYYRQQCYFIWDEIRHNSQGGALVRVSTRAIDDNFKGADNLGKDFIRQIEPVLLNYLNLTKQNIPKKP